MLSFLKKKPKPFFTPKENELVVAAIKKAEQRTSGEVRVYIENRCRFVDPIDRAVEIFHGLKMNETTDRNAVLVYIAMKDRQLAIYGDEGIHRKVGTAFWQEEVKKMVLDFHKRGYAPGIAHIVTEIGEALTIHFPYNRSTDINELPDDIVFGN